MIGTPIDLTMAEMDRVDFLEALLGEVRALLAPGRRLT